MMAGIVRRLVELTAAATGPQNSWPSWGFRDAPPSPGLWRTQANRLLDAAYSLGPQDTREAYFSAPQTKYK